MTFKSPEQKIYELEERIKELEAALLEIAEISEYGVKQGYGAQYECSGEILEIVYNVLGNR